MKKNISLNSISIKHKIFILSGILILGCVVTSGIAIVKMGHIGQEIAEIAEKDIPLSNVVTSITVNQLEQAVNFEKAIRFGLMINNDADAIGHLEEAVNAFNSYSKDIITQLTEGIRIATNAAPTAKLPGAGQAFEEVAKILAKIEKEHLSYEGQVQTVFGLLSKGDVGEAIEKSVHIELEEEKINHELLLLGRKIGQLSADLAKMAERDEKNAFSLLITVTVITIVFSLLLAHFLTANISRGINYAVEVTERISTGDLTQTIDLNSGGEIGQQLYALKVMQDHLRSMIGEMGQSSTELSSSSEELAVVSEQTTKNLCLQQTEVEQVATAMNEMAATINEVAKNAAASSQAAQNANKEASEGGRVVEETIESIEKLASGVENAGAVIQALATDSENIGSVLDVIKGVAEQTNLLALNAAIEAARAGEQGRGFAVVADEVRTLAQRTQQSTHEIEQMIEKLQSGTQNAVSVMIDSQDLARHSVNEAARAGASLEIITAAVGSISDMNIQIASAAEEQSCVAEEMNNNITSVNSISEQNATAATQTTSSSEELSRMAAHLQDLILRFKV